MRHRSLVWTLCLAMGLAGCAGWGFYPWDRDAVDAARAGDREALEAAFADGARPDTVDPEGRSLVYHAAVQGHRDLVQWLVEQGADPDHTSPGGRTALHDAVAAGQPEVASFLLQAGADPDRADEAGRTPLMEAAARGHHDLVETLLTFGADPDRRTVDGDTALSVASARRHTRSTRLLRDVSSKPASAPAAAGVVRVGDVETLRWMMDRGLDPSEVWEVDGQAQSLLDVAARYSPRAAAVLIREGGVVAGDLDRALVVAALYGDPERVTQLLDEGADPDAVVDSGDATGRTALMEAARLGHVPVLQALFDAGADATLRDEHGATALWHAAVGYWNRRDSAAGLSRTEDRDTTVRAMLAAGVTPGEGDIHDFGPVHAVAAWGSAEALQALIEAGAYVEQSDRNGRTALAYAAQYDNLETAKVLLQAGADVQSVDRLGVRPIVHAALAARIQVPQGRDGDNGFGAGVGVSAVETGRRSPGRVEERLREEGALARRTPVGADTPGLTVDVRERRIMQLERPLPIYDTVGYDDASRFLPYTTACADHGCRVPPVLILPPGAVVELIHRAVGEDGRLHGTFLVHEPGLDGVLFEDWVYGEWPPAGYSSSQLTIGRVAHIRSMPWVEAYGVNLREASGGVIW